MPALAEDFSTLPAYKQKTQLYKTRSGTFKSEGESPPAQFSKLLSLQNWPFVRLAKTSAYRS